MRRPHASRLAAGLPLAAVLALAVLPTACTTTRPRPFEERLAEFMRPWEELKRQKAELWRNGWDPQEFVFEGQGTVTVRHWELTGVPGDVYLTARVTYTNTTEHPVETAFVWLDVLDSEERVVGSAAARMVNPMGYPFWPGHSYTTVISAFTNGVHLDPAGWNWTVACEAPIETDPGLKPVLVDHELEARRHELASRSSWYRGASYRGAPILPMGYPGFVPSGPHVPGESAYR